VTVDPFLHLLRVVGQHVGAGPIARHLDPGREPSVDKGRVKPETRAGGDADPVKRDDAQDQGAGGVANAVDDHPFAAVADSGVLKLVLIEEAAVVLPDAIIRTSAAISCGDHASRAHDGQEEIERMQPRPQRPIRREIMPPSSARNLTRAPLHTTRGLLIEYPSGPYALKLRVANDSNTRIRHTKSNPAETLVLKQMLERTSADALPVTRNQLAMAEVDSLGRLGSPERQGASRPFASRLRAKPQENSTLTDLAVAFNGSRPGTFS